jgi:hypothetical protein
MQVNFSVDLVSDLNVTDPDSFDWEGKATSLYCCIAGNVASDLGVLEKVLGKIAKEYFGVFFVEGSLEHDNLAHYDDRVTEIKKICKKLQKVVYLHQHVVILNGTAFVGVNGFFHNREPVDSLEKLFLIDECRNQDVAYLTKTIDHLQNHDEVKNITIISNSIPSRLITFMESSLNEDDIVSPALALVKDTGGLVTAWLFGNDGKMLDSEFNGRRYVNHPYNPNQPYFPKRVEL